MKQITQSLCFLIFFITTQMSFANTHNAFNPQKITGANSFLSLDKKSVIVRIGVDPRSLGESEASIQKVMEKITVVGCAYGSCQFAKLRSGLGFYEVSFVLPHNTDKTKSFQMQIIACSHLGCTSKTETVKIFIPPNQ